MTRCLFDALPGRRGLRTALLAGVISLSLAGCEATIAPHGHAVDATELDQIVPGQTSLVDLTAILGKPSFEGAFDSGKIYYLSEVMVEPPGGRKRASTRTLIVISLEDDIVREIEVRDETSGNTSA